MNRESESAMALAFAGILVVVLGWIASEPWAIEVDRLESQWERQVFGADFETEAHRFVAAFSLHSQGGERLPSEGLEPLFDRFIQRISHRLAGLTRWLPATVLFLLALLHDALKEQQIGRHRFHFTSPRHHHGARKLLKAGVILLILLVFVPLPVPPLGLWLVNLLIGLPLYVSLIHAPRQS